MILLCVAVTVFIGWCTLYLLSGREHFKDMAVLEKMGLSYLFGFGAVSLEMFIMGLFGIGFTRFNILIPWVLPVALAAVRARAGGAPLRAGTGLATGGYSDTRRPVPALEIVLIAFIALQTFYNFLRALAKPIESYDAVAIHGLKSKIIFLAGGINPDFFQKVVSDFHGAHADYPLFIPLAETWVYTFLGKFNDVLVKMIFPLFYLSLIFVFYAVLKRITKNRVFSLLFTFFLASVKQFSDYSTIGATDLELGIFFAVSVFYLYLWMGRRKTAFLNISLLSALLCLWTKNEGTLLSASLVFIVFLYALANVKKMEKRKTLHIIAYAIVVVLAILSWSAFKDSHGLVNEDFNLAMVNAGSLAGGIRKMPVIIYEYQKHLFGFKKWNIIWVLFVLIFIKGFRVAFSGDLKYLTLIFFLSGIGYTFIYIFSVVDIDFFVRTTTSRFLLHILPVAVFWMAVVVKKRKLIGDS